MSENNDGAEREHSASTKRRGEFSSKGEVVKSKDLLATFVLLMGVQAVLALGEGIGRVVVFNMRTTLSQLGRPIEAGLMLEFAGHFWRTVTPIAGLAALAAVIGGVAEHRGVPPWSPPAFNLGRVNPIGKLSSLLSPKKMATHIGISLLKVAVLAIIFTMTLRQPLMAFVGRVPASLLGGLGVAGSLIKQVLMRGLSAMLLFGFLDYGMNWWALEKRMRMTFQEVRDESKEDNGDPRLRGKRRKMGMDLIKRRSLANVHKADVVLVNPTHVSVAIAYSESKMQAPTVIAKGADALAEQIRAIARKHRVPIVSQPPLARQLYAEVQVGASIPQGTYQAVAVILAHVYRLKRRVS